MKHLPHFLTGMTAFVDGVGLLGKVKQVTLPKVEQMRETVTQGGFERSVNTGLFKAMECEITLSEYSAHMFNAWNESKPLVIQGSIQSDGTSYPIRATLKGEVDIDDGTLETGKETERKVKVYVDFYDLTINHKTQVLIDVPNMVAKIQGTDLLDTMRSHLTA